MSTTDDNRQWHFDTYHPLPSDVQACGTCLMHGWEYSSDLRAQPQPGEE